MSSDMHGRLSVAIVDDEVEALAGMRALLARDPDIEVVGEAGNGRAAIALLESTSPDLVLLDIQMPGPDGFDVLRALGDRHRPDVIFVTAFQVHAPAAFEVQAIDYLLKPFTDARLAASIGRAKTRMHERRLQQIGARVLDAVGWGTAPETWRRSTPVVDAAPAYLKTIPAKTGRKLVVIRTDDVTWIEGASYYARVHVAAKSYLIRQTLSDLETRLDPQRFLRVHRSAIINLERVKEVGTHLAAEPYALLDTGARVPVSRGRLATLVEGLSTSLS
jgi:two-component system LytT family response regulator